MINGELIVDNFAGGGGRRCMYAQSNLMLLRENALTKYIISTTVA